MFSYWVPNKLFSNLVKLKFYEQRGRKLTPTTVLYAGTVHWYGTVVDGAGCANLYSVDHYLILILIWILELCWYFMSYLFEFYYLSTWVLVVSSSGRTMYFTRIIDFHLKNYFIASVVFTKTSQLYLPCVSLKCKFGFQFMF